MGKKLLGMMLIFIFVALLFSGCSKDDGTGKSFAYPIKAIPESLDPQVVSGTDEKIIVSNCFEGLVRLGQNGELIYGAAESYTVSENGKIYTFKIRDEAKWHLTSKFKDVLGEEYKETFNNNLTAQDFVFAFKRALNSQTGTPNAKLLYAIKNAEDVYNGKKNMSSLGITAIDEKTLQIELSYASAEFLSVLAQPMCMPCNEEFFEATGGRYGRGVEYTLCNGPFYLSKIVEDTSVSIHKNDDYNGESKVFPSSVNFKLPDKKTVADGIVSGSYSAAVLSSADKDTLNSSGKLTIAESENITWALCLNTNAEALKNINLRRALFSCVDVSVFNTAAFYSDTAKGLIPSACLAGTQNYRALAQNVQPPSPSETALALWEKALNELDKDTLTLTVTCSTEHEVEIRTILQKWQKEFGISCVIKVNAVERADLEKTVSGKNYEIAFAPVTASQSSALSFLDAFSQNGSQNIVSYSSEEFSSLLSKASVAGSAEELVKYCKEAEQTILNAYVIYPVFFETSCFVMNEDVSGIQFSPAGEMIDFISAKR